MPDLFTYRNSLPEQPGADGPLSGMRVAVQPNLSVNGWPCNAGSHALAGYTALADATTVARLTRSGAVLIGSSHMAELGFGLADDTIIQIIADGRAELALITDTMGEARVAASGAGLFGFKPSYGLISRCGLMGLVPSMECIGLVAADPARIGRALAVMAGSDPDDPSMPDDCAAGFSADLPPITAQPTAGIVAEWLEGLNAAERSAFESSLARLDAMGIATRQVNLAPSGLFRDAHQVIAAVEASSSAGKYDGVRYGHRSASGKNWNEMYLNTRAESFGPLIKPFLFQGAYFQFENYSAFENACRIRGRLMRAVTDLLAQVDMLVLPTRRPAHDPGRATTIEETYDAFGLALPANLTGHPVLQVPDPTLAAGTDLGLQLIGRRLDDARLLSIGRQMSSIAGEGC
ncbi:amidase family protein [Desulfococcus multivorans]|uniref:Amidase n=1 Tax=Desulfococcus multivorans DSM 2059 TaxID=1121405 RepID=S7U6X9_DESML|nr:amidase family protein [Desulfococcus multivorans]AOY59056.1 GatA: glutamyl-tRNA(Gln) amidotransferase, subunit alpha [Desulfococcus multivorans]EPR44870.1 Amidase [Desulfococcus multivorans DSM 2059]SJZ82239.1 aspartyl-tRNA(Asn)/glutamyl-tRNA(Gln) amidotransferase subunit A [Desulfococcus multivorans DSM 2059]